MHVFTREHARRNGEAERLGGLEVDDELDFRGLLDRKVCGLVAIENAAGAKFRMI
jgi:hypothetical protein